VNDLEQFSETNPDWSTSVESSNSVYEFNTMIVVSSTRKKIHPCLFEGFQIYLYFTVGYFLLMMFQENDIYNIRGKWERGREAIEISYFGASISHRFSTVQSYSV